MRKLIIATAALAFLSSTALAQNNPPAAQGGGTMSKSETAKTKTTKTKKSKTPAKKSGDDMQKQ